MANKLVKAKDLQVGQKVFHRVSRTKTYLAEIVEIQQSQQPSLHGGTWTRNRVVQKSPKGAIFHEDFMNNVVVLVGI